MVKGSFQCLFNSNLFERGDLARKRPLLPVLDGRSRVPGRVWVGGEREERDDLRVGGNLVADVAAVAARRHGDGRLTQGEADGVAAQVKLVEDLLNIKGESSGLADNYNMFLRPKYLKVL